MTGVQSEGDEATGADRAGAPSRDRVTGGSRPIERGDTPSVEVA